MLPLEKLTEEAAIGFRERGINTDDLSLVLELDLDHEGNFGETWLAFDAGAKKLYTMSISSDNDTAQKRKKAKQALAAAKEKAAKSGREVKLPEGADLPDLFKDAVFAEYNMKKVSDPYVDNFVSSNRLLAKDHPTEVEILPADVHLDFDEEKHRQKERDATATTIVIAYSTNARKRKLFAFIDIMNRLVRGDNVKSDDPIFEQFNAKCPKCGRAYADQERKICDHCTNRSAVFFRLFHYFKPFKLQLGTVLLCMLASSGIQLINPILSSQILYDQVISQPGVVAGREVGRWHNETALFIVIGIIFAVAILSLVVSIVQNRANATMSTKVTLNMKMDIFTALQSLSLSFFNNNQTGKLITRVNYDADRIRAFFIDGVPHFVINAVNFIGLTIFLFSLNWQLTLIVFIPVPIIVCIFKFALPKLWRALSKQWRHSSSLNAMLGDSLTGIRVVKAFSKEAEETARFYENAEKLTKANLQANLISLTIFPVVGVLIGLSSQVIWGFGGIQVMDQNMTYGQFATYLGYIGMIFGPLNFFTNFTNQVTDTANCAQRMFEIIDAIPEITDAKEPVVLERLAGDIEFSNVCFHYAANRPILKNVSLKINAGDHIGLVGHTGSGKSTIANLINRLYDTISGTISIDGHNVKEIATQSLRKNISIVSQEIFLFKGTIADNIRYARPDATMEEVIAAAKAANAHDFILRLPEGYETLVGTGSRSLSGGEQQRISIARALLLAPSILILDEATAAMDTETERLIQDALTSLIEGRTTITIAHRLSTLKDCNKLFVIENGEIAEEGSHAELIEKKGVFFRLYTLQNEANKKIIAGM
ncbi:MAG: ABC transporter ATP-binding protein [Ruminococcaceae bacterium]|nr:ABC transporter ATP-binding protein [Oscillospiraceae bacterium]